MTEHRLEWIQHAPRFVGQLDCMEFCLPSCTGIEDSEPENLEAFKSPDEAMDAGFAPCETCRPV